MKVGGAQVGLVADRAHERSWRQPTRSIDDSAGARGAHRRRSAAQGNLSRRGGRRLVSILSPEQLFREDVMRRLGQAARNETSRGSRGRDAAQRNDSSWCSAWATTSSGCRSRRSTRSARCRQQITRLPKTPKFLEGVVNLRGDVLPVVDQRRRFDMPAADRAERRRLVVVRTERHRAGLIVDSVSDVLRVPAGLGRAAARPDRRDRTPGARRDQSRAVGAHRAACSIPPSC